MRTVVAAAHASTLRGRSLRRSHQLQSRTKANPRNGRRNVLAAAAGGVGCARLSYAKHCPSTPSTRKTTMSQGVAADGPRWSAGADGAAGQPLYWYATQKARYPSTRRQMAV